MMHVHCRNLTIIVGCIIINSFACIAAGRIDGQLILSLSDLAAASLLVDRAQDMEKLSDALHLRVPGNRVRTDECHTGKTRHGR